LIEIFHEIVIILTLYDNCNEAKKKFSKLHVYMRNFLRQGLW